MGLIRAVVAALALTAVFAAAVQADDYGPRRGVREVRAAVPILVHARLKQLRPGEYAHVDDAIVDHDNAIADWHSAGGRGVSALTYAKARWWLLGTYYEVPVPARSSIGRHWGAFSWWNVESVSGEYGCLETDRPTRSAPTAESLVGALHADPTVAAIWALHVPAIQTGAPPPLAGPGQGLCDRVGSNRFTEEESLIDGVRRYMNPVGGIDFANPDGFRISWNAPSDWAADVLNAHGRAPTDAEMTGPGANSISFLYATIGPKPISAPKTTLAVWCPFVLDSQVHYFIEFAGLDKPLGPIPATLDDNVLTFEVPPFTAPPSADIRGEIGYLPLIAH